MHALQSGTSGRWDAALSPQPPPADGTPLSRSLPTAWVLTAGRGASRVTVWQLGFVRPARSWPGPELQPLEPGWNWLFLDDSPEGERFAYGKADLAFINLG